MLHPDYIVRGNFRTPLPAPVSPLQTHFWELVLSSYPKGTACTQKGAPRSGMIPVVAVTGEGATHKILSRHILTCLYIYTHKLYSLDFNIIGMFIWTYTSLLLAGLKTSRQCISAYKS